MPKLNGRVPTYRLHRHSGQAILTLNGVDYYLGPHGTAASMAEYDRLVAEWLAGGRRPPVLANTLPALTVNHIILDFWEHAQTYYRRPDGTPTSEVDSFKTVFRLLRRFYGNTAVQEFGPLALKALQQEMIRLGWCRKSINKQTRRLIAVFKWAVSEEKIPAAIYEQMRTVPPLKRGRTQARETQRVRPVPDECVQAIEPFVSRQVWGLVRLQLLTGARPGELVLLRGVDLHTQGKIWTAEPEEHKTAHHELSKTIYFGPQSQVILQEYLQDRPLDAYLFSALEAEQQRDRERHAARKTPASCGNRPGTQRNANPARPPADHYTVSSYRRAIARACDQAFPLPETLARRRVPRGKSTRWERKAEWKARLGPEAWAELKKWEKTHRWHPHQLRHNAGTSIRKEFGVEVARVILGQRSLPVTEIYAEMDEAKARSVIGKIG